MREVEVKSDGWGGGGVERRKERVRVMGELTGQDKRRREGCMLHSYMGLARRAWSILSKFGMVMMTASVLCLAAWRATLSIDRA